MLHVCSTLTVPCRHTSPQPGQGTLTDDHAETLLAGEHYKVPLLQVVIKTPKNVSTFVLRLASV